MVVRWDGAPEGGREKSDEAEDLAPYNEDHKKRVEGGRWKGAFRFPGW